MANRCARHWQISSSVTGRIMPASLPEPHRRAIAQLAAAICPTGPWPPHLVIVDDLGRMLQPGGVIAAWWVRSSEIDQLNESPLFRAFIDHGLPSVILLHSYGDLLIIAVALGQPGAA